MREDSASKSIILIKSHCHFLPWDANSVSEQSEHTNTTGGFININLNWALWLLSVYTGRAFCTNHKHINMIYQYDERDEFWEPVVLRSCLCESGFPSIPVHSSVFHRKLYILWYDELFIYHFIFIFSSLLHHYLHQEVQFVFRYLSDGHLQQRWVKIACHLA